MILPSFSFLVDVSEISPLTNFFSPAIGCIFYKQVLFVKLIRIYLLAINNR